jgi:hypothetical protein
MLYLYALTDAPALVPPTAGLGGAPLEVVQAGEVDAVVAERDGEPLEPTEEAVLLHAGVVDDVAALNEAVLPARFGRAYADRAALRDVVGAQAAALGAALDRVRGCCELGLRILARAEAAAPAGPGGRDYLLTRLQQRRRVEGLADAVHEPLAALARAHTRTVGVTPQLVLSAAYLVERDAVESFREAVDALAGKHPELTLALTGPWPPYSFADAEAPP